MPIQHLSRALALVDEGIVTRRTLVAAGLDADMGDRLVRERVWSRLAPSIYCSSVEPPRDDQLVRAARAMVGGDFVITGLVACRARGMRDVPARPGLDILVSPQTRWSGSCHIRVHQSTRLPTRWVRGGECYATAARAVADGARAESALQAARALVLAAVSDHFCSASELAAECEAGPQRGSALLRRAVADATAGAWSAPEAEASHWIADAVRARRLPPFLLNPLLSSGQQRIGRPDGYLVGAGVGWQVDSRRHHGGTEDFDATLAVHDQFAAHGIVLLHVTPRRLRELGPRWVDQLVAAASLGRGDPAQLVVTPAGPLQTGSQRWRTLPG